MVRRPPRARALREDLNRLGAAIDSALDGGMNPPGGGDVGAGQHGTTITGALPSLPGRSESGGLFEGSDSLRERGHHRGRDLGLLVEELEKWAPGELWNRQQTGF